MQKNSDLYFEGQNEKSKLVYSVGLLWGKINSTLDEVLGEFNLNVSKFNVLMIIKHIGGYDGIQQNEISKRLLVTASNITKLLDKLEKEGLITRNAKKEDKRVKLIRITDFASKLLDDAWIKYSEKIEILTSNFSEKDAIIQKEKIVEWLTNIK